VASPPGIGLDIYGLGMLLGELLTGDRLPRNVRASAHAESKSNDDVALARGLANHSELAAALRGRLDAIVAKATTDDASFRYRTASQLADDIDRHLATHPIPIALMSENSARRRFLLDAATLLLVTALQMVVFAAIVAWLVGR
jgi:hypothetical protein